jgi:hypothetical protein
MLMHTLTPPQGPLEGYISNVRADDEYDTATFSSPPRLSNSNEQPRSPQHWPRQTYGPQLPHAADADADDAGRFRGRLSRWDQLQPGEHSGSSSTRTAADAMPSPGNGSRRHRTLHDRGMEALQVCGCGCER